MLPVRCTRCPPLRTRISTPTHVASLRISRATTQPKVVGHNSGVYRIVQARAFTQLKATSSTKSFTSLMMTVSPTLIFQPTRLVPRKPLFFADIQRRYISRSATLKNAEKDLYEILGVSKTADSEAIKKAFMQKAKELHPDVRQKLPDAEKKFDELRKAYEILRDPEKRKQYDYFGFEALEESESFEAAKNKIGFGFFKETKTDLTHGQSVEVRYAHFGKFITLPLTFEEAVNGCHKKISYKADVPCEKCNGTGSLQPEIFPITCKTCKGTGTTTLGHIKRVCSKCHGCGTIVADPCPTCNSKGRVPGTKEFELQIPPGVDEDTHLRGEGQGHAGLRQGKAGTLFIRLKIAKHPLFKREKHHIRVKVPITPSQAVLGGKIKVPQLNGEYAEVPIKPGTQTGDTHIIPKKGIPNVVTRIPGDMVVEFVVKVPKTLSPTQRRYYEELAKEDRFDDPEDQMYFGGKWSPV